MRKCCEENERIKRQYLSYLKYAKGQDEKSLDKAAAAILKYEQSTGFKPFKKFHIEQATKFRTCLENSRNRRTKKPLSLATIDGTLRLVKAFFHWLAGQPGYKSRVSYPDCEYFNNNSKNARIAHTRRDIPYPSMEMTLRAFQAMPKETDIEKRDKAVFALLMITGARDGAAASLRLKHVNLDEAYIVQDARDVKTKNAKTFTTWFFPVDPVYHEFFSRWVEYLRDQCLFGPEDPLLPKPLRELVDGKFFHEKLSREPYANAAKIRTIIRNAFAMVQLPEFTPHSFRKTLWLYGDEVCDTMEQRKAWSLNLGHERLTTSVSAYMPVSQQRQGELIKGLAMKADID